MIAYHRWIIRVNASDEGWVVSLPGILGLADFSHTYSKETLQTMLDQIMYCENYAIDSIQGEWFAIGRADLPTFNPEPQGNNRGNCIVFCQGNITNKTEMLGDTSPNLSNADLIAQQYATVGVDFVNRAKGHFTAAICDTDKKRLFLVNDRFGKHQMYFWTPRPETIFFASETKCLISVAGNTLLPNVQAIADFLQFQFILGEQTYFKEISLLPQASILQFDAQGLRVHRYWRPELKPRSNSLSKDEYLRRLHDLLSIAISRATRGHKVGVLLSGGLDTRNIAAHLPRSATDVHAFTYGHVDSDDAKIAQLVANNRNFAGHFIPTTSLIIPELAALTMKILEGNASVMTSQNMVILDEAQRNGIAVLLDGVSGNRLFALPIPYSLPVFALLSLPILGTLILRFMKKSFSIDASYAKVRNSLSGFNEERVLEVLSPGCRDRVKPLLGKSLRGALADAYSACPTIFDLTAYIWLTQYQRRLNVNTQNCCRWKVEMVDALLDYDLVDFAISLPHECKLWRRLVVDELKAFHQDLMAVPLHGYARPTSLASLTLFLKMVALRLPLVSTLVNNEPRPVNGFAAILREQSDFFEKVLFDNRTATRGFFNMENIRKMFDEHLSSKRNHTRLLYRILSLELWFRTLEDSYGIRSLHI